MFNSNVGSLKKFIVIPSLSIGGAEKRFFDIFAALYSSKSTDYYLILPKSLEVKLSQQVKIPHDIAKNIIALGSESDNLLKFCLNYAIWLWDNSSKGMHFHYPLNSLFPLHFFSNHHVTISLTNCYYPPAFFSLSRSLIRQRIAMFFAKRIDVLNSSIYEQLNDKLFFSKNKLSLTPGGTFVNPSFYNFIQKKPKVAIISRLIDGKGVIEFLELIPSIWDKISNEVDNEFSFSICGDGVLADKVEAMICQLKLNGIPINYHGFVIPSHFLKDVSVVLSLQKVTNYPSRVVAESTLSGAHVLIRDSGDSRKFGIESEDLTYISKWLEPAEIAEKIIKQLRLFRNNPDRPNEIRRLGLNKYSSHNTAEYFHRLINLKP
jgi:glycosyltransferase involved in cell wall biosynthesis